MISKFPTVRRTTFIGLFSGILFLSFTMIESFLPDETQAADIKLTPGITLGGSYDDNVLFSSEDTTESSIVSINPSITLDYKSLLSQLSVSANWDILQYLDENDLDRTNQYYRITGKQKMGERWKLEGGLNFYRDTTLNSYLQEIGRVYDRIERDYLEATAKAAFNLTQVDSLSTKYRFQTADYDTDNTNYTDYDTHRANLYYNHQLKTQVDTLSIGPSYYHRKNERNVVESYSLDIGWARDWSTITHSSISLGARYSKVNKEENDETDDNWGGKISLLLSSDGEVSKKSIRYFHDLRTTVDGDDVNVDNFHIMYRRLITERMGLGINGRLVFSYKLFDQQSNINDERYYWIEPFLSYDLTKNLEASLRYRYQNNVEFLDDDDDRKRDRNIVWVELSYGLPFKL